MTMAVILTISSLGRTTASDGMGWREVDGADVGVGSRGAMGWREVDGADVGVGSRGALLLGMLMSGVGWEVRVSEPCLSALEKVLCCMRGA